MKLAGIITLSWSPIWVWEPALSTILQPPQSLPASTLLIHTVLSWTCFWGEQTLCFPIWRPPPLPKTPVEASWLSVSHALSSSSDIHGDFNGSIKQNASINIRKFCWLGATFKVTWIFDCAEHISPRRWAYRSCMNYISQSALSVCGNSGTDVWWSACFIRCPAWFELGLRCLIRTGVSFRSFPLVCHYLLLPVKNKFCLKVIFGRSWSFPLLHVIHREYLSSWIIYTVLL